MNKLDLAQFEGHTPGPWKATRISDATGKNWIGYEIGQARNLVSKAIARSLGWTETDGGIDSRLIAAAPALLALAREQQEQIKVLREALQSLYDAFPDCEGGEQGKACKQARQVLKGE